MIIYTIVLPKYAVRIILQQIQATSIAIVHNPKMYNFIIIANEDKMSIEMFSVKWLV